MPIRPKILVFAGALLSSLAFGAGFREPAAEPLVPLPEAPALDARKVRLGAKLFADKRLSRTRTVSCASCHDLARGGDDHLPRSVGVGGTMPVNAPTIFNSGYNASQFWDGRSKTLEEQVSGALLSPTAMGGRWDEVIARLSEDPDYVQAFAAYRSGITRANVEHALAEFERSLVTPNAPLDRYLRGKRDALSPLEKEGLGKFKSLGCVACHQGRNLGGNMFQTMGVMRDYFKDRGGPERPADLGRFNVTKDPRDRHVFRVPSLRNVMLTAPYFHDGSAATIEEAVRTMARYQLGRELSNDDVRALTAFLGTLTGELPLSLRASGSTGGQP